MAVGSELLALAGYAVGALGGALLFIELFMLPSYVEYEKQLDSYSVRISPMDVREYTWAGRVGALLIALAFAIEFVAVLL